MISFWLIFPFFFWIRNCFKTSSKIPNCKIWGSRDLLEILVKIVISITSVITLPAIDLQFFHLWVLWLFFVMFLNLYVQLDLIILLFMPEIVQDLSFSSFFPYFFSVTGLLRFELRRRWRRLSVKLLGSCKCIARY